ncbi:inverse autotransporter beta domain-containing protein [Bartonella sp. DGB2]|uniref:inverse autotransporter beta domain-containing protein n=1 Tax=Bartonella sp. DGB2 TaxID=3388426 RepID=UPI00398FD6FD
MVQALIGFFAYLLRIVLTLAIFFNQTNIAGSVGLVIKDFRTDMGADENSGPKQRNFSDWVLGVGPSALDRAGEAGVKKLFPKSSARLNFGFEGSKLSGSGDVFLPLIDTAKQLTFMQLGLRSSPFIDDKQRWIGNFGIGQRWFPYALGQYPDDAQYSSGSLMLGYNAFFDHDFSRGHNRGSLGLELQKDWVALASNYYMPLSGWKDSGIDVPGIEIGCDAQLGCTNIAFQERPAAGFDIAAKAILPTYRQIAFNGKFSQWFGEQVGLGGKINGQKDPQIWSYGIEYTPVPALRFAFDQQLGSDNFRKSTFSAGLHYVFGVPWKSQFSASKVQDLSPVGQSRYEFVNRENNIILEYRHEALSVRLNQPEKSYALGDSIPLRLSISSATPITKVDWHVDVPSGTITSTSPTSNEASFKPKDVGTYHIFALVSNKQGEQAQSNTITIEVSHDYSMEFEGTDGTIGKGETSKAFTVSLFDGGKLAKGAETQQVRFSLEQKDTPIARIAGEETDSKVVSFEADGKASVTLEPMLAGTVTLSATLMADRRVHTQVEVKVAASHSLTFDGATGAINQVGLKLGVQAQAYQVTLLNHGKGESAQPISFTVEGGATLSAKEGKAGNSSSLDVVTGSDGSARVYLTPTEAGPIKLQAQWKGGTAAR